LTNYTALCSSKLWTFCGTEQRHFDIHTFTVFKVPSAVSSEHTILAM